MSESTATMKNLTSRDGEKTELNKGDLILFKHDVEIYDTVKSISSKGFTTKIKTDLGYTGLDGSFIKIC